VHGRRSTDGDVANLRVQSQSAVISGDWKRGAHKHGLAICIYDLLLTCAQFGVRPSDSGRVGGIESKFCEGHRAFAITSRDRL